MRLNPLTARDVAARLDRAALRVVRILTDLEADPVLAAGVLDIRYTSGIMAHLAAQLADLGISPRRAPHAEATAR